MSNPFGQISRIGELKTPLGKDALVLTRFSGREQMSAPFEFQVEALHAQERDRTISFDGALGKNCTVTLTSGREMRFFVGTLAEARRLEPAGDGALYSLVLRPWLWMLTKRVNSRIFHKMTVTDIIGDVFSRQGGLADHEIRTSRNYPTLEYCVQHNESDFAFVSRLMEAHGIGYYFKFADDKQTMVLSDSRSSYDNAPGGKRVFQQMANEYAEFFTDWRGERRFTTGKATLTDYNFKAPRSNLRVSKQGDARHENAQLETYLHPGKYKTADEGKVYAEALIDAARAEDGRFLATGVTPGLFPGSVMQFAGHPENGEYLVLECKHNFYGQAYRSEDEEPAPDEYHGEYVLLPAATAYAPPIATPKPVIAGPQTAVVVSECDEYGRIKVRFHWGNSNTAEESMWCRIAQSWAGAGWGAVFLPRIDMEVLVEFIDGDPDQPIVTGSVYNANNMPPYPLPDKQSISGFKSQTMQGSGYNEFIMDDAAGSELVRLHAQKDMEGEIVHDRTVKIGNDDTLTIDNDLRIKALNNITIEANNSITLKVGGNTIVIDKTGISVKSTLSVTVEANTEIKTTGKALATHEGLGLMTIKGGLVKIN